MIPARVKAAVKRWRREPTLPAALRWLAMKALSVSPLRLAIFYMVLIVIIGGLSGRVLEALVAGAFFGFVLGAIGGQAVGEAAGAERVSAEVKLILAQRQEAAKERAEIDAEIERQAKLN